MDRYDDEIRELEERMMREREALIHQAESLTDKARSLAVSPKGLLFAAAFGFLLGEVTRPRSRHQRESLPAKVGMGGVVGGLALALIKAQYGSPLGFARAMWEQVEARRARTQSDVYTSAERSAVPGYATGIRQEGDVPAVHRIAS